MSNGPSSQCRSRARCTSLSDMSSRHSARSAEQSHAAWSRAMSSAVGARTKTDVAIEKKRKSKLRMHADGVVQQ